MTILTHIWSAAVYIIPFIFVLSTVVFFHELGHFLVGRWCGVKVDAFSLGFGPELFAFVDRHGTRWRLAALPLGGYVKFHGDANGASMTDSAAAASMAPEDRAVSFFAQPVAKRAAIVAAGPIANFILAIVIFTGVFYVNGRAVLSPLVDAVSAGSAAEAAGFQPGDLIVSIDGRKIDSFEDMQRIVQVSSDAMLTFGVDRAGKTIELVATPRRRDVSTPFGTTRVGVLGVETRGKPDSWRVERYGLIESFGRATSETWYVVARTGSYLGGLVMGRESADQLSGPIRIAEVSGEMAKIGIAALLNLAAVLSISVGLLNLMPIPLLDGGHLFYYAVEAIRGRALNEKAQEFGFKIGLTLVAGLMIFATFNDILRLTRQLMRWG
ncbi:membrane-associated zinc metalloprotease [Methylocella silvestris BL2]|uniref:Zinc metalloprotease n=1 Tax=Methylocella silvestris (strain DSM 15510 / CIP 108128 / LMG 27833 / NCIMB 13906 / BL2) TaxID=395965 RepID=B8EMN9_METSB|nr:RIP metalloprotease RseP [Methylocella silvestris]ACK52718.1 membrane-associated zinc metalloprotease [Methylocella silvestris BL2]